MVEEACRGLAELGKVITGEDVAKGLGVGMMDGLSKAIEAGGGGRIEHVATSLSGRRHRPNLPLLTRPLISSRASPLYSSPLVTSQKPMRTMLPLASLSSAPPTPPLAPSSRSSRISMPMPYSLLLYHAILVYESLQTLWSTNGVANTLATNSTVRDFNLTIQNNDEAITLCIAASAPVWITTDEDLNNLVEEYDHLLQSSSFFTFAVTTTPRPLPPLRYGLRLLPLHRRCHLRLD